jgi:hypothetical protein
MLVYGDRSRTESPREKVAGLRRSLELLGRMSPGIERHGELVATFIEAGELLQAIADAEFEARGADARSPATDAATALVMDLARAVRNSWASGFENFTPIPATTLEAVETTPLPESIRTKLGEGYAFYALYPEGYLQAAAALPKDRPTRVIGIRSIGAGLAALVAVAAGAPPPVTVRPGGHPFRRTLSLSMEFAAELTADREAQYAIVDEGPGLSGSSFGAVAEFLESRGVPAGRMRFFPSHAGDLGPQAEPRHREQWAQAARHVVDFDTLVLRSADPRHRLEAWFGDLLGDPVAPLEEVSGGAWRAKRFASEADWPPADVSQERRKFLYRSASGTWLLRFVGLGREGMRKAGRARELAAAGFSPEVAGVRHGFLAERWYDARPLESSLFDAKTEGATGSAGASVFRHSAPAEPVAPTDHRSPNIRGDETAAGRSSFVEHLGRSLGFRARRFVAGKGYGASLTELVEMARYNSGQALGEGAAAYFDRFAADLPRLEAAVVPVETDNRLQPWEWLRMPDGRLLKTDAVDHHAAHDLVGCQDVAWDAAGAVVEFGLSDAETAALCRAVEIEAGRVVGGDLLRLLIPCYLAFQLGRCTMAADGLNWREEAGRLRRAADGYAQKLAGLLIQS